MDVLQILNVSRKIIKSKLHSLIGQEILKLLNYKVDMNELCNSARIGDLIELIEVLLVTPELENLINIHELQLEYRKRVDKMGEE